MRDVTLKMEFFETYYFVNIIFNVLTDESFDYIRSIHSWYEDREAHLLLPPFPRWSALHDFAAYTIENVILEGDDESHSARWFDFAFKRHGIDGQGFDDWLRDEGRAIDADAFYDYVCDLKLTQGYEELLRQMTEEVFFVLFGNRTALLALHRLTSGVVQDLVKSEVPAELEYHLARDGVLRRVAIPAWARRAVFYRDRGMCAQCLRDLSGVVNLQSMENFDHIVPLRLGGLNDVTNIQLLCRECNSEKSGHSRSVSKHYQRWFGPDA